MNKHYLIGSSFPPRLSHYIIGLIAGCTNGFWITEGRELLHLHAMEFIQTHGEPHYTVVLSLTRKLVPLVLAILCHSRCCGLLFFWIVQIKHSTVANFIYLIPVLD